MPSWKNSGDAKHIYDCDVTQIPKIELLWWQGCPSTERALAELRVAMEQVGLADVSVDLVEIHSEEDARRERFTGSPTIGIDRLSTG